jgi:L-seryl-tRNA(Ser) seleniumtransferase
VIFIEDLGSGVLIDLSPYGMYDEPIVSDILKAGVDLVMFSGDKLLGGPQAGIIAGRADIIAQLKSHPLMRALRIDKISMAALETTLRLYRAPYDPLTEIPVLSMLSQPVNEVEQRANNLAARLLKIGCKGIAVKSSKAFVGGGSLPQQDLPSFAVTICLPELSAKNLGSALNGAVIPVISRIEKDQVLLDMRTVQDNELSLITQAMTQILKK